MKPSKPVLIIAAVATIALVVVLTQRPSNTVEYQGHRIPVEQLRVVDPHPGCEYAHYHALASKSASATDGTHVPDESDCGYGPIR